MRTMHDLVSDILNLNDENLAMLAEALVMFTPRGSNKAQDLADAIKHYRLIEKEVFEDMSPSREFIL